MEHTKIISLNPSLPIQYSFLQSTSYLVIILFYVTNTHCEKRGRGKEKRMQRPLSYELLAIKAKYSYERTSSKIFCFNSKHIPISLNLLTCKQQFRWLLCSLLAFHGYNINLYMKFYHVSINYQGIEINFEVYEWYNINLYMKFYHVSIHRN